MGFHVWSRQPCYAQFESAMPQPTLPPHQSQEDIPWTTGQGGRRTPAGGPIDLAPGGAAPIDIQLSRPGPNATRVQAPHLPVGAPPPPPPPRGLAPGGCTSPKPPLPWARRWCSVSPATAGQRFVASTRG